MRCLAHGTRPETHCGYAFSCARYMALASEAGDPDIRVSRRVCGSHWLDRYIPIEKES
jgi:hypothetical protein